jgi:membrane fusion protein (multidrug efflux system)
VSLVRQLLVLAVVMAAAGGGWLLVGAPEPAAVERSASPRPIPVQTAEVRLATVRDTVEAVATSRAEQAVEIRPAASGRVEAILFEPGQRVGVGDLLVELDAGAEQAAVDEATALLEDAKGQYERGQQLARTRSVADARVAELRANFLAAQARVAAAAERLADRQIRAPFAGIVGLREVSVGARVDPDTTITTLDSLDRLEVEFSVPEQFYAAVRIGAPITATTSVHRERTFDGRVTSIDSRIDPVARAFRVRASIPNPDLALPVGVFMVVQLVLDERAALTIPEQAVILQGRSAIAYRINGTTAERVELELGQRSFGRLEVLSGLGLGDVVATTGLHRLRDGAVVEVQDEPTPPVVG